MIDRTVQRFGDFLVVLLVTLLLVLCAVPSHGQQISVKNFKGVTLGDKVSNAEILGCSPDNNVQCVLLFEPELNVFPIGEMPTRCGRCTWIDWTKPGVQINGSTLSQANTSVTNTAHPGFDFAYNYALASGSPMHVLAPLPLLTVGANSVLLMPCPLGISAGDSTHTANVLLITAGQASEVGNNEKVTVTGFSGGTGGGVSCTISFTTVNPHTLYLLSSATRGIQEAINDAADFPVGVGGAVFINTAAPVSAPLTTIITSIFGVSPSAQISGDPGNNPLITILNRPASTYTLRVSGFTCTNTHSTVTDIKENCLRSISSSHVEIDHLSINAGSGGVLVTSFGGGGLSTDTYVHDINGQPPLKDFVVQVNGDGVGGVTSDVKIENITAGDLGSGPVANSPRHDVYVEDCTRCHMKHLFLELDGGFTGANDTAIADSANHAASVADDTWDDVQANDNGSFAGFAASMQSNKTYNQLTISNSTFNGFGGAISCGQTYSAANQLNHVVFRNLDFTNTQNSGSDGVTCGVTGGTAFDEDLIVDNVNVTGTGAGTTLRGFHFIQMNSITVRNSSAIGVATHGFDFEGVSKSTIALNVALNNGKTATGDGILLNTNAAVVSDANLIYGNRASDTQGSPTQRFGINNNQASGSLNLLSANFFTGNLTGNIHDANNLFVYGPNASGTAAEMLRVSPLATGRSANTDQAGHLTLAAGTASYTFVPPGGKTYATAPICTANDTSSAAQSGVRVSTTTTTLTVTGNTTDGINYICFPLN